MSVSKGVAVERIMQFWLKKLLQENLALAANSNPEEMFRQLTQDCMVLCIGDDATDEEMFSFLDPDVANEFAFPDMTLDVVGTLLFPRRPLS